jgi:hypothetical protein
MGWKFRRHYDQEVPERTSIRHAVRRHRGVPLHAPKPPLGRPSAAGGAPGVLEPGQVGLRPRAPRLATG